MHARTLMLTKIFSFPKLNTSRIHSIKNISVDLSPISNPPENIVRKYQTKIDTTHDFHLYLQSRTIGLRSCVYFTIHSLFLYFEHFFPPSSRAIFDFWIREREKVVRKGEFGNRGAKKDRTRDCWRSSRQTKSQEYLKGPLFFSWKRDLERTGELLRLRLLL